MENIDIMSMKIPEDWHRCVVPIETIHDSQFIATGFLMNFYTMPCLVTNKHVIGEKDLQYRLNLPGHLIDRIRIGQERDFEDYFTWVCHPDDEVDLAAILVPYEASAIVVGMYFDTLALPDELYDGREIFYWGFPLGSGAEKSLQHYPIMRTGVIAQSRFENKFMVEANVFPGSSGSPIYTKPIIIKDEKASSKEKTRIVLKAPKLIGIVSSYITYRDVAISEQTGHPRVVFQENSGLAWAMKADCIFDIITSREFTEQATPLLEKYDLLNISDMRARASEFSSHGRQTTN
jgi:hypothetical protein